MFREVSEFGIIFGALPTILLSNAMSGVKRATVFIVSRKAKLIKRNATLYDKASQLCLRSFMICHVLFSGLIYKPKRNSVSPFGNADAMVSLEVPTQSEGTF